MKFSSKANSFLSPINDIIKEKDQLKEIERGAEYDWQEIGKSN